MKVLFIHPNISKVLQMPMGIASISAYLEWGGVETFLWDNTFETVNDLKEKVLTINPDFVCFGSLSPDFEYTKQLVKIVREITNAKMIIGGPHATFETMEVMKYFDVAIRGDGEYSLLDYITTQDPKTKGAWVKEGSVIHMNEMGTIPDVNILPWANHGMFKKHFKKRVTWAMSEYKNAGIFITARGCPFKCTYCGCNNLHILYPEQKVTRFREIDNVIEEIKTITEKYEMEWVWMVDETLTVNKGRIVDFCKKYKRQVGLPFAAETRADTVDEEVLKSLKDAGCEVICMGIESGVDRIRNGLYKKNISREKLIESFQLAKKLGLKISSFNICGAPTETPEDVRETIKLNKECGVDMGKMTIFNVYPGSGLYDYCNENGYYIRKNYPENYYIDSNVKHKIMSIEKLIELRKEFVESLGGYTGSTVEGVV
jgi:radical SAM superfamily enzyme YgiQ (UPF0313 family)